VEVNSTLIKNITSKVNNNLKILVFLSIFELDKVGWDVTLDIIEFTRRWERGS